jgi:hypothetical protein
LKKAACRAVDPRTRDYGGKRFSGLGKEEKIQRDGDAEEEE